jgi:hypothetical protein
MSFRIISMTETFATIADEYLEDIIMEKAIMDLETLNN